MPGMMLCTVLLALAGNDPLRPAPAEQLKIAEGLRPSLVKVEYELRMDKGEVPVAAGWAQRCPNCGQFHLNSADSAIADERGVRTPGFLVSARQVVAPDMMVHPRFVKSLRVRFKGHTQDAKIVGYAMQQPAMFLEISGPLPEAKPLSFGGKDTSGLLEASYVEENGTWTVGLKPVSPSISLTETGRSFLSASAHSLLVNRAGQAVGLCMTGELPVDTSWQGGPESWPTVREEEMRKSLQALEEKCSAGLPRVSLHLRSPKSNPLDQYRQYSTGNEEEENATQRDVPGVMLDGGRVLVLANLSPKVTARLERVLVHLPGAEPRPARFVASLTDFGCLLAELDRPAPAALPVNEQSVESFRNRLLLAADIRVKGENRNSYLQHTRIASFQLGWHDQVYPVMSGAAECFLFDPEGRLIAVPVERRKKVTAREQWESHEKLLTPVAYLTGVLKDVKKNSDPNNIPLEEGRENRLAWLGVELQGLNRDLARVNKVADLTRDGETGALITYVYPDSPAGKAEIAAGDILLRLDVEGQPKPLEVRIEPDPFSMARFPWSELASRNVPAEYLNRLPRPWGSPENSFSRALTELGFGTKYTAELWHNGKLVTKSLQVVESPPHFDMAAKYKSDGLGMTVREVTYEVRRYYQMNASDPGVVVSKIEPGGKAAVAGILPYELITHVNDVPVASISAFEKAVTGSGELRLSVKRENRGRIVKLTPAPTTQKSGTQPGA